MKREELTKFMETAFLSSKDARGRDIQFKLVGSALYDGDIHKALADALDALTAAGMVILSPETVAFLDGSAPINGKWFGDIDEQEQSRSPKRKYWWRKYLRAMTEAANEKPRKP